MISAFEEQVRSFLPRVVVRLDDENPLSKLHRQHWGVDVSPDELVVDEVTYQYIPLSLTNIYPRSDGRLLILSQYTSLYERILARQARDQFSGVVVSGSSGIGTQFQPFPAYF